MCVFDLNLSREHIEIELRVLSVFTVCAAEKEEGGNEILGREGNEFLGTRGNEILGREGNEFLGIGGNQTFYIFHCAGLFYFIIF